MPPTVPLRRAGSSSRLALAGLAYLALTACFLRPIWRTLRTAIAPDLGDPLFLLYVLKWGVHEARLGTLGRGGFWNAPFYFPLRGVTALSEHMLGPSLLATAWTAVDPDLVACFNLLLAASFVAGALAVYWVLARSGRRPLAAFLGGAVFAFSHFRWEQLGHLQILLDALVPLVLWSWDRLLAAPTPRRAAAFVALYALHLSGCTYLAYMILFPLAALAVNRLATPGRGGLNDRSHRRSLAVLLPALAIAAALTAAIFFPYWREARRLHLARNPGQVRVYGASLASYVTPSARSRVGAGFPASFRRAENALFPGFLPAGLAAVALRGSVRRRRPASRGQRAALAGWLALAAGGFLAGEYATWSVTPPVRAMKMPILDYPWPAVVLAAGLAGWALLRWRWTESWPFDLSRMDGWERGLLLAGAAAFVLSFPVIYAPLMYVVPGLDGMRVPARFYPFLSFPLAAFAARGFETAMDDVADSWRRWGRRAVAALVVAVVLAELAPLPLRWLPVEREASFSPAYAWIAGRADVRAVLELPMVSTDSEVAAMYRASRHWKPIVNGYSGYMPGDYLDLYHAVRGETFHGPDAGQLARLRGWGVTHLLVRATAFQRPEDRRTLDAWAAANGAALVYEGGGDRVYRLVPAPQG